MFLSYSGTPSDFLRNGNSLVTFHECDKRHCVNIEIVDDLVLEDVESFNVSIVRNGLDNSISLNPEVAQINITDNDG